jgi:CubicO group peptidase (beta-lactamase class C family)
MYRLPVCGIVLVVVSVGSAAGARAEESPLERRVAGAIDRVIAKHGVTDTSPGVAVCILQPGKLQVRQGYGLANLKTKSPITPATLFELASVTKPMTATGILILEERGLLSLEDDVRKHLPELPEYNAARPIKIVDLLRHVSGLPEYMHFPDVPQKHVDHLTNADFVTEFARQRQDFPLAFPTGRQHGYCNTNYMLLASVIARVSGKSYAAFMRDEIFTPCGMRATFVYDGPKAVPADLPPRCNKAIGYGAGEGGDWNAEWGSPPERNETLLTVGDGGVWTNLVDFDAFDAAIREHRLVRAETMQRALATSRTADGEVNTYGLGWGIYPNDRGGLNGFGHGGSWGGFRTMYYADLNNRRTTIVLSNRGSFDPDAFWDDVNPLIDGILSGRKRGE